MRNERTRRPTQSTLHGRLISIAAFGMVFMLTPSAIAADDGRFWVWRDDRPAARLVPPRLSGPMEHVVDTTVNGYFAESYRWSLPNRPDVTEAGNYILVGDASNNRAIRRLVDGGLRLGTDELGEEGFRLFTHEADGSRYVIVTAKTPTGLKHGCLELVFYRTPTTQRGAWIDWPMDVTMSPAFAYRGVYVLPCWAAFDSHTSWERMIAFMSDTSVNRIWFWLAGFPLLKQYGGEYAGTDLSDAYNVNGLAGLTRSRGMKFYIGGGWFTWHHEKIADGSIKRGVQYYLDMLSLVPDTEGIYLEPAGEGRDTDEAAWRKRTEAFGEMAARIWKDRPAFEFAIAIGEFNADAYRRLMHEIDETRTYWWWCWGDPIRDNALAEHPLVLRWHTNVQMSDYHGSTAPPEPSERALTGFATSYDPGQGFGNPWNGWGALGHDQPRNFDPNDMPYFSHQYWFRERCWNVEITEAEFAARLARRLFDDDVPEQAIKYYLTLASMCPNPKAADVDQLSVIDRFVAEHVNHGTARTQDTLRRMRTAIEGIRAHRQREEPAP